MTVFSLLRLFLGIVLVSGMVRADITLPAIISDHMVLAKTARVPIWGRADPEEEIMVTLDGKTATARTGADGRWAVSLNLEGSAPGPFEMTVGGKNKLVLSDVVVGEVWIASGQSNMEFPLKDSVDAEKEMAVSANPLLRQFLVKKNTSSEPLDEVEGRWVVASPQTVGGFSAVGYYFAKKLQNDLKVPVGVVCAASAGTPLEAWISVKGMESVPDLKTSGERLRAALKEYPAQKKIFTERLGAWISENGREDKPAGEVASYVNGNVPAEGWVPVKIPGEVIAPGLPRAGAVWLRKEIDIPKTGANLSLSLPIDGFDSVYWNGRLLKQTTWQDFPGTGYVRRYGPYDIPSGEIRQGKNILAIRLYEPVGPAKFTGEPKAGSDSLAGEWLARAEYEFPPLNVQKVAAAPQAPQNPPRPLDVAGYLFDAMIHPLLPYAISGVIWYQGENNIGRAWQYCAAFPLLIADWRAQWNRGDFPFYFCQLANYMPKKIAPEESLWAELREAQSMALRLPNTGQAVLVDLGESGDIHFRNKKDVGERLSLVALAKNYGKAVPYSGPVFDSIKVENGKAVLCFQHTDGGLAAGTLPGTYDVRSLAKSTAPLLRNSPGSQLEGFSICGEDGKWVWADAKIDGDRVIVWSDKVPVPFAVRYAWADNPTCNLYNGAGLPASPFRTDDFPPVTLNGKY